MAIWSNSRNGNLRYSVNRQNASGIYIGPTQGLSSPKNNRRGCLCINEDRYGRDCCGGALISQGIGNITGIRTDIVRDGLLYAYDYYDYTPGQPELVDKSGNGLNAIITGSIELSQQGLVFNGTNSGLHLPSASYLPWDWTYQTYGTFDNAENGWNNSADYPTPRGTNIFFAGNTWKWLLQSSGSSEHYITHDLYEFSDTFDIKNQYAELVECSLTNRGLGVTPVIDYPFPTDCFLNSGSVITMLKNDNQFPNITYNCNPLHANEWGSAELDMHYGSPRYEQINIPGGGIIQFQFAGLKAEVKYILAYNRALTDSEILQNNIFFSNHSRIYIN